MSDDILAVNKFYGDNEDLRRLGSESLQAAPLVEHLRKMRALEGARGHLLLQQRARWLEEGVPVSFAHAEATKDPDGTITIVAKGKPKVEDVPVPNLKDKKLVLVPSLRDLNEEIDVVAAPYYTANGAVAILEIILGVRFKDTKSRLERLREFFKKVGPATCSECGSEVRGDIPQPKK